MSTPTTDDIVDAMTICPGDMVLDKGWASASDKGVGLCICVIDDEKSFTRRYMVMWPESAKGRRITTLNWNDIVKFDERWNSGVVSGISDLSSPTWAGDK